MNSARFLFLIGLGLSAGCGGTVVFEDDGSGGDGSGANTGSTQPTVSTSTGQPTSSGTSSQAVTIGTSMGCISHDDCGELLCQFGTGLCVAPCSMDDECSVGFVCDFCATSSCPGCRNCVAACVPGATACVSHDDCGGNVGENVCVFATGLCAQRCGMGSPLCPPGSSCNDCATSSCPMCADCLGACQ